MITAHLAEQPAQILHEPVVMRAKIGGERASISQDRASSVHPPHTLELACHLPMHSPKGVEAQVVSTGDGFAVNVSAEDGATIAEITRRAQAVRSAL